MTDDEAAASDNNQVTVNQKQAASDNNQVTVNQKQAAIDKKQSDLKSAGHTRPHLDSLEDIPVGDYSCLISSGKRKRRFDPNLWKLSNTGLLAILKTEAFLQKCKGSDSEPEEKK